MVSKYKAYKAITVRPADGGKLMTRVSSDEAGLANYTVKRDFRRDLDQEMRREGHDYFWPNITTSSYIDYSTNPQNQPFPNNVTLTTIATITRSSTTATATVTAGHMFVVGESVTISGATQTDYNGTFTIVTITRTTFTFVVANSPTTPATGSPVVKSAMPINLVALARRPNGKTAIIVGTATRLFRFFAVDSGNYFEGNGTASRYLYESDTDDPGAALGTYPYFNDNPGDWIIIGNGYSASGNRWEHVDINGYSVFNNGVDLPVTYRVEDSAVVPIYEMREQGILSVGTIAQTAGVLFCADIAELDEDNIVNLFGLIGQTSAGDILATQSGSTVTSNAKFFGKPVVSITRSSTTATVTANGHGYSTGWSVAIAGATQSDYNGTFTISNVTADTFDYTVAGSPVTPATGTISVSDMVNHYIVYGTRQKRITAYISPTQVTVSGTSETVASYRFSIKVKASQTGSYFSGNDGGITGALNITTMVVTASAAPTPTPSVGQYLRFTNGITSKITAVTDTTHYTLTVADAPVTAFSGLLFYIIDGESGYADYVVSCSASIFTSEMVGRTLSWDGGESRKIRAYISATEVRVQSDLPIVLDFFGVENPATYGAYTDPEFVSRIQYRTLWSAIGEPLRFSSSVPAAISSGSRTLTLDYPAKSFEAGQEITILGAGVLGGNLAVTILSIAANRTIVISSAASTSVTGALVQRADATGSIVGHYDIQGDSSAIIAMLELHEVLVIYKDTGIFLASYTGVVESPFEFRERNIQLGSSLFYKNTLVSVGSDYHIYAGKNAFYSFDLTTQRPKEVDVLELCKDVFFTDASLANTNRIWATDNSVTKELLIVWPSSSDESGLLYDYLGGTVSTTGAAYTSAATVKRPETGTSIGATEDWFVMATAAGVVLLYGLVDNTVASWSSAKTITYRRHANPFSSTKTGITSVLKSGLSDFGDPFNEKALESYTLIPASQSVDTSLSLSLLGVRSASETAAVLTGFPYTMASPASEGLVPVYFVQNYFQDSISITGYDNKFRLSKRIWNVSGSKSASVIRGTQ